MNYFRIFFLFLFIFLLSSGSASAAASKVFEDNFDLEEENSFPSKWYEASNNCSFNGNPAKWKVVEGKLNIKVDNGGCSTEIVPKDFYWNNLGNDYVIDFDMHLVKGSDHNFAFRWENSSNWYDFHIQGENMLILERMDLEGEQKEYNYDFKEGTIVHFQLVVQEDNLMIYVGNPGVLLVDREMGGFYPKGRIALRATSGLDSTETNFDNIMVTGLNQSGDEDTVKDLQVSLLKQNNPLWGNQIYNGANFWSPQNPTINNWGCALTSATMILKYYGINKLPDGTLLDPGTLNTWLKNNNGYDDGINNGYILPTAIASLSKKAKSVNNITQFDALEADMLNEDKEQLKNDIKDSHPDILGVNNDSHYVVGKGFNAQTYLIHDPFFNKTTLQDYNNEFSSLTRYIPSFTDLSYILISATPTTQIKLIDQNGNILEAITKQSLVGAESQVKGGAGSNIIFYKKPLSGKYTLTISGDKPQDYKINTYLYDINGNLKKITQDGFVNKNQTDTIAILFDKDNSSKSSEERIVTPQDLINDINEGYVLGNIKKSLHNTLLSLANNVSKNFSKKNKLMVKIQLDVMYTWIKVEKGWGITKPTFSILEYDINYLKSHLN